MTEPKETLWFVAVTRPWIVETSDWKIIEDLDGEEVYQVNGRIIYEMHHASRCKADAERVLKILTQ